MDRLHRFVSGNHVLLLIAMLAAGGYLSYSIPKIDFNDLFAEYFDESIQFRVDNDFIRQNLTGVMALHYEVASNSEDGIFDPEYLNQLDAFAKWFSTQQYFLHVDTLSDVMKRLNRTLHGDDPEYYRNPDDPVLAAQYMLLYELSLPYGLDLNNLVDVDRTATRMSVILDNIDSKDILLLDNKARSWLAQHAPLLKVSEAVGPSVMFAHISERNLKSMIDGMVLALLLISTVILLSLRTLKLGLLSLLPNTLPILMAYGAWALISGELGMSGTLVSTIVLGVIVDNTVHFLSKYLRAKREKGESAHGATRYAFRTVGIALAVTTIILVGGFSVLGFSAFEMNSLLGQLSAMTFALALIVTYLLLPPLLYLIDGSRSTATVANPADRL